MWLYQQKSTWYERISTLFWVGTLVFDFFSRKVLSMCLENVALGAVEKRGAAEFEKAAKPKKGQTQIFHWFESAFDNSILYVRFRMTP